MAFHELNPLVPKNLVLKATLETSSPWGTLRPDFQRTFPGFVLGTNVLSPVYIHGPAATWSPSIMVGSDMLPPHPCSACFLHGWCYWGRSGTMGDGVWLEEVGHQKQALQSSCLTPGFLVTMRATSCVTHFCHRHPNCPSIPYLPQWMEPSEARSLSKPPALVLSSSGSYLVKFV